MDEATSALDNESERIVQDSIDAFGDKTIVAIAHRLDTIRNFDRIIVIDNHRVVEEGTHEELVQLDGIYKNRLLKK